MSQRSVRRLAKSRRLTIRWWLRLQIEEGRARVSKRSATETVSRIFWAFIQERTWTQTELARVVGISARALRLRLQELEDTGVPLEREDEPPHTMWSVPKDWLPSGVALNKADVAQLLRFVARSPQSTSRDVLMKRLLRGDSPGEMVSNESALGESESILAALEDSVSRKTPVRMRYFSASKGVETWRYASVQRVTYEARMRFIAICHRSHELRWFRVSGARQAMLDETEVYVAAANDEVDAMLARSVDGWDEGVAREMVFAVYGDDARWVRDNLPGAGMTVEAIDGGIRIKAVTSGVQVLARFVVGLGGVAVVETPELADRVEELARGALARAARRAGAVGDGVVKAWDGRGGQEKNAGSVR